MSLDALGMHLAGPALAPPACVPRAALPATAHCNALHCTEPRFWSWEQVASKARMSGVQSSAEQCTDAVWAQ